ncbi:MAG: hypothetical protein AB7N91_01700 [Candidatus Tectimicrobiota bacterium]
MNSAKYDVKIFLDETSEVEPAEYIPVFHRWIQEQRLPELLIDVADYRHVHHGPGVVLVAHDGQYAMDAAEGRPGLLYSRRRETHASRAALRGGEDRLRSVLHDALTACQYLESDPVFAGRLRFRGDELLLWCNDRLVPDTEETYAALAQHVAACAARLYPGQAVEVTRRSDRTGRVGVWVRAAGAPAVETLLARLGGAAMASTNGVGHE